MELNGLEADNGQDPNDCHWKELNAENPPKHTMKNLKHRLQKQYPTKP